MHPVPANPQHSASVQALGPRPQSHDPLVAAARAANVGARLELEHARRAPDRDRERRFERIEAAIAALSERLDAIHADSSRSHAA